MTEYIVAIEVSNDMLNSVRADWSDAIRETTLYKKCLEEYLLLSLYEPDEEMRDSMNEKTSKCLKEGKRAKEKLDSYIFEIEVYEIPELIYSDKLAQLEEEYEKACDAEKLYRQRISKYLPMNDANILDIFRQYAEITRTWKNLRSKLIFKNGLTNKEKDVYVNCSSLLEDPRYSSGIEYLLNLIHRELLKNQIVKTKEGIFPLRLVIESISACRYR